MAIVIIINREVIKEMMIMYNLIKGLLCGAIIRFKTMILLFFCVVFSANSTSIYSQCKGNENDKYLSFLESASESDDDVIEGLIYLIQYETGLSYILNVTTEQENDCLKRIE